MVGFDSFSPAISVAVRLVICFSFCAVKVIHCKDKCMQVYLFHCWME